jgi:hypothetical protein
VDYLGLDVVGNDPSEYDLEGFNAEFSSGSEKIRPLGVGEGDTFLTAFTVANTSERERTIVRAVSLQIEDFEPPPDRSRAGCVGGIGGGMAQEEIEFEVQLNSESTGVEQPVSDVPTPGTVLELGPNDLQAFKAHVAFSAPGVHRYRIVVHYDTSAGHSAVAVSEPLQVLLMPSAQSVEWVPPAGVPMECPRGEP